MGQEVGNASYYAAMFHGRKTASGEIFDNTKMTCAHRSLPFGTILKVINLSNNKEVIVKVNDRGPYVKGRVLDLSHAAAKKIGITSSGVARVSYEVMNEDKTTPIKENNQADTSGAIIAVSEPVYYELKKIVDTISCFYGVRVATVEDGNLMLKIAHKIERKYNQLPIIQRIDYENATIYKIFAGKFAAKENADKLYEKIKKEYKDTVVMKYGDGK